MNKTRALIGAIVVALVGSAVPNAFADEAWSYSIKDGEEHSTRAYLLVDRAGTPDETRVRVRSACHKPHESEGTYGQCVHRLTVGSRRFELATGADVVLARFTWDAPLLLATVEYGCCAGPSTVRFYDEKGAYLGSHRVYDLSDRLAGGNLFTRTIDAGNGTRSGARAYLVVSPDPEQSPMKGLEAVVFEGAQRSRRPVHLTLPNPQQCADWVVSEFTAYADRSDLTLKVDGMFCPDDVVARSFSCVDDGERIDCKAAKE